MLAEYLDRVSAWQRKGKHSSVKDLRKFCQTELNSWSWIDLYKLRKTMQFLEDQEPQLLDNSTSHYFSESQITRWLSDFLFVHIAL